MGEGAALNTPHHLTYLAPYRYRPAGCQRRGQPRSAPGSLKENLGGLASLSWSEYSLKHTELLSRLVGLHKS